MFVTSGGFIYVWLPGLVCLLALAELFWRSGRLILAFGLGHVGATLVVAFGLAAAIQFDLSPMSVARARDVGISYGAVAVLGTLTAAIPARWRPGWIGWWLAVALLAVVAEDDFANAGHLVALIIGMVLSVRFSTVTQWTPVRCVLLTIGASFCYLVLANELSPVTARIAGLLGALIGRWATHRWRSRRLRLPASPGLIADGRASEFLTPRSTDRVAAWSGP